MLETEQSLWHDEDLAATFRLLDRALLVFFLLEYLLRFGAAGEVDTFQGWRGRLRWMTRHWHTLDLFFIVMFLRPTLGAGYLLLRLLRIRRAVSVLRLLL